MLLHWLDCSYCTNLIRIWEAQCFIICTQMEHFKRHSSWLKHPKMSCPYLLFNIISQHNQFNADDMCKFQILAWNFSFMHYIFEWEDEGGRDITFRKTPIGWRPHIVFSNSLRYSWKASGLPDSMMSMPSWSSASIDLWIGPRFFS